MMDLCVRGRFHSPSINPSVSNRRNCYRAVVELYYTKIGNESYQRAFGVIPNLGIYEHSISLLRLPVLWRSFFSPPRGMDDLEPITPSRLAERGILDITLPT